MTTYTAEDFANAEAARHPETGRVAARLYDNYTLPWVAGDETWLNDQNLADQGWEPAYVSRNPQKMRRHISDLEAVVKHRGEDIARLEEQRARLARELAVERERTVTLDALQAAWEGAEQGEVAEGDVLIRRSGENFTVWVAGGGWSTEALSRSGHTRVLHRAPKPQRPEGAEAIEEALLKEWLFDGSDEAVADLADRLARRGVLVVEGGK